MAVCPLSALSFLQNQGVGCRISVFFQLTDLMPVIRALVKTDSLVKERLSTAGNTF